MSNKGDFNLYSNQGLKGRKQPNENKIHTTLSHKRGTYSPEMLQSLQDGEVFYDITGKNGIFIGCYNVVTGKIDVVKLAGPGGGSLDPTVVESLVSKDDVVTIDPSDVGTIYEDYQVASANTIVALNTKLASILQKVAELENNKPQSSDSIHVNENGTMSTIWGSYSEE